jgi:hypothetical protein
MSAQGIAILDLTVTASAVLTRYRFVTAAGAHSATDLYGVARFDGKVGDEVTVAVQGTEFVEAGAAIPAGAKYVIADAQGRVVAGGAVNACAGKVVRGQSAAAAGDLIEIVLCATV